MSELVRAGVRVEGTVQGVGFRPFVYGLADRLGLSGLVGNDASGAFAEIEGNPAAVAEFLARLEHEAPPLARIDRVTVTDLTPHRVPGFVIVASQAGAERRVLVATDSATCDDCLAELNDPADRRYRYAFINCTNCGPRFTIVRDVPYDRATTTMAAFGMCRACAAEYSDPANRRFHAQPVCCPACGPRLTLVRGGERLPGDPLTAAASLLRSGQVLAVKGLGGYHLAVDARSEQAARTLRARKHREDKPFALMVFDLDAARRLCEVDDASSALLTSPQRPIVLMPRRDGGTIAASVAPGHRNLGVMLPYTPLHHLLLAEFSGALVMTSGNVSDEPIAYDDADALHRLSDIADAFLSHDRPIHTRTDDTVLRSFRGRPMLVRRSRGQVPEPITVRGGFAQPLLACGAELKNTFCLAKGEHAVVSHHIGDLQDAETWRSYLRGIEHFKRLFDIEPKVVAHDLHPEYLSTKYAIGLQDVELYAIQHHHAHIASCLADNAEHGPVIGVAFDGTGYGADGTVWGGEFLIASLSGFDRVGHLADVPMPGGTAAIRAPWRMAAAYLAACGLDQPDATGVARRHSAQWNLILTMASQAINSPRTSSAGRLFDAAAAILGIRDEINYEGQAAIELEQLAASGERSGYRATVTPGPVFRLNGADLIAAMTDDLRSGLSREVIAGRFHHGVAALIEDGCALARERSGLDTVALSGGVFQNHVLLHAAVDRLQAQGFRVLLHSRVPCNDGGISLGQAAVAACVAAARPS